ncbi:MAG: glycosyltransferase family 39 protein [Anaerolineae bacterium]
MTIRPFPKHALVALALAFFAFLMSAEVSRTVFQRLPHLEDEVAYLYQARMYAGGNLVISSPDPRRAYWQPFLIDQDGLRFGKYTPGWSMQLAVGTLMGQEWVINAFFSALTVALVYRLGREIFDPDVGVIAAALTAFSPMALLLDGTLMGHTSALFAATLFFCWRVERGRRARLWGAAAGNRARLAGRQPPDHRTGGCYSAGFVERAAADPRPRLEPERRARPRPDG